MPTSANTTHILKQVVSYLGTTGIEVDLDTLIKNINPKENIISRNNQKNMKFKIKPKKPVKFKVKDKENLKPSVFSQFVEICDSNDILYFQFNDELNWKGPAIKINPDTFDNNKFRSIDIHILYGYGFGILRPKTYEDDSNIEYEPINYNECKLEDEDIEMYNSDDEPNEDADEEVDEEVENTEINKEDDNSCESEEEIILEEWKFEPTNTIYLIDQETNNLYSNETETFVGKRLDDHNIDFDAKVD
ncbi:MAG: hypothetical protein HOJ35_02245 [Bdellovibrionales bacterium]|jgi:hypothetical protein|nr:hypothetical protein [Bdellovibrionales bacterium]